jgi:hypothetical protein
MKLKALFIFGMVMIMSGQMAKAQNKRMFESYSTVNFGFGTSTYIGELAPYRFPVQTLTRTIRWNVNGSYTRHFTPNLAARVSLTVARIAGDDEYYNRGGKPNANNYTRNLHFRNDLKEVAIVGIYQFVSDGRSSSRRANFTPYVFAGIGIVAHNPKALTPKFYDKQEWVSLQPLGTEGQGQPGYEKPYSLVTYSIPVGLGFRYKYNDRFNISIEGGFRFTGSDYLDDVGGYYADPSVLKSDLARDMANRSLEDIAARTGKDRIATAKKLYPDLADPFSSSITNFDVGDLRGSPSKDDAYFLGSIQLNYILPGKIKCPPLK